MSYRVRRKFTSSTFYIDDQICKIFFDPEKEYQKGYWFWKVGFVVGKSKRQLNDWFHDRKNKRTRSIMKKITGRTGMKAIRRGFQEVLRLRWIIEPGDCIELDCTSGDPDRQFHALSTKLFIGTDLHITMMRLEIHLISFLLLQKICTRTLQETTITIVFG